MRKNYKPYPKPDGSRSGCKVSWHYYAKRKDAEACAEAAKHNAVIAEEAGYDFGYCSPGSIELVPQGAWPGTDRAGKWEVCLP